MDLLPPIINPLREAKIMVSLFIDPNPLQIEAAHKLGADYIELNTAAYSEAQGRADIKSEISALRESSEQAHALGMGVHAGHGLTYLNVEPIAALPHLEELNIGHSIVSHAIFAGFEAAVREMTRLVEGR
jgi:pyridoxine 5-phosphate synthase